MAIRTKGAVVKDRQDAVIAAGVAQPLVEVLLGPHLEDRQACDETSRTIQALSDKNDASIAAFKDAGAVEALEAVVAKHGEKAKFAGTALTLMQ